jgi:hypothetical protein
VCATAAGWRLTPNPIPRVKRKNGAVGIGQDFAQRRFGADNNGTPPCIPAPLRLGAFALNGNSSEREGAKTQRRRESQIQNPTIGEPAIPVAPATPGQETAFLRPDVQLAAEGIADGVAWARRLARWPSASYVAYL